MKNTVGVLFFLGLTAAIGTAQPKGVTGASDAWPPYADPSVPGQGISVEIVRDALATQGYSLATSFVPWARAEAGALEGAYDLLLDVWKTESRAREFLFSEPYAENDLRWINRRGEPFEYSGLDGLSRKIVGVVRGYAYSEAFYAATNFVRVEGNDTASNIRNLVAGRLDLVVEDRLAALNLLRQADPTLLNLIEVTPYSLSTNKLYVATALNSPRGREILGAFNRGMAQLRADGRLAGLMRRLLP